MKVDNLSIYHKNWKLKLNKTGERLPDTINIEVNDYVKQFVAKDNGKLVINYVEEKIKDSIKKQESINEKLVGTPQYQLLMSSERISVELLLDLCNSTLGRVITNRLCKKLEINNNDQ